MKLSKRERTLLIALVGVGLIYLVVFVLFLPSIKMLDDKKSELTELRFSQAEMEMTIASRAQREEDYKKLDQEIGELRSLYAKPSDSVSTDIMITNLCLKRDLIPRSLTLAHENQPLQKSDDASPVVSVTRVEVAVDGTRDNILSLVGEIAKRTDMRISSLVFNEQSGTSKISFDVYFQGENAENAA